MGSVVSYVRASWLALLIGIIIGRVLLARFI